MDRVRVHNTDEIYDDSVDYGVILVMKHCHRVLMDMTFEDDYED